VRDVGSDGVTQPVFLSLDNLAKEIDVKENTEDIFTVLDVNGADGVNIMSVNPLGTNKIYNLDYFMTESSADAALIAAYEAWQARLADARNTYFVTNMQYYVRLSEALIKGQEVAQLQNVDLAILENERATYVEMLAQGDTSTDWQSRLDDVNERIAAKETEIAEAQAELDAIEAAKDSLFAALQAINAEVSLANNFTPAQLLVLDRFFKEDSIEDSSFVLDNVASYTDSGLFNDVGGEGRTCMCTISTVGVDAETGDTVSTGTLELYHTQTGDESEVGREVWTVSGGTISLSSSHVESGETVTDYSLSAKIVKATIEQLDATEKTFVLTGYLNTGSVTRVGEDTMTFGRGCITLSGTYSTMVNVNDGAEDPTYTALYITVVTANAYFSKNVDTYAQYAVESDLYDYGQECLRKLSSPSYTFSLSSANFLALDDFVSFANHLTMGQRVYIDTDHGAVFEPYLIGVELDFEDPASMQLQFGDTYALSDTAFQLADLLEESVSMGKTVETGRFNYNSWIESGASTAVRDFMTSALDVAKNNVLSSSGQGVSWDESGLHLRKYASNGSGYDPEEIWAINNSIVFTNDSWAHAKMAIGKIVDPNLIRYSKTTDAV